MYSVYIGAHGRVAQHPRCITVMGRYRPLPFPEIDNIAPRRLDGPEASRMHGLRPFVCGLVTVSQQTLSPRMLRGQPCHDVGDVARSVCVSARAFVGCQPCATISSQAGLRECGRVSATF